FLEYFIIQEGKMWDSILEILKRKVAEGVKVRIIYDDMGCFFLLPKGYAAELKKFGIECIIFNPFRPFLSVIQNNRDHRKIASVDGKVAFTGGINLADEYINAYEKHGHWKDSAMMVSGDAAWGLTVLFLQMWELCTKKSEDYSQYFPGKTTGLKNGYVIPYCDSPLDTENVGEHVYLQIINNAKDYVYINTPYLIIDDSMVSALTLAAKSGVDVRIVTPHIADKFYVHAATRSYYRELINAGVKIYEYTNGFIHSKTFVSDDYTATVGTTNLDFRSLYLQFECGVLMYNTTAVGQVKEDFLNTLEICQQITKEDCRTNMIKSLFEDILRLIAPLM
ncbi:MAG: cardiolipin synthase, partial [Monoglobales bacterium]